MTATVPETAGRVTDSVTLRVAALWLGWCAFRDAISMLSMALVVPFDHRPAVYVLYACRLALAAAAAGALWRGTPTGVGLGILYLATTSVVMFSLALAVDPIAIGWTGTLLSWPVLAALVWTALRRRPVTDAP